ncbi:unnamed protein product [Didymodactylos carnosus]|uniref:Uncharacterized protein n=1 Tax=Didymodactylos carnosus TaxID=1234261 RepID=A0A8S2RF77_9BILA|nr:unnamed protein product [Didymodactylos carnosus]CAF4160975.1 unnamed protein product [Didymodactylos carnosus]CAF4586026.1 unnamed protein product [Didymodactylos carnosus]
MATSDTMSHILLFPITIPDENNNLPYFIRNNYQLNVSEATRIGSRFLWPEAQDQDQPPNNIQFTYTNYDK